MRRLTSTAVVLVALLLGTVAAAPGVSAQDSSEHPAVGAWIIDTSPEDATDPMEILLVSGVSIALTAGPDGIAYGSWEQTGSRSADATFLAPFNDPGCGCPIGLATIRTSIEVAEDGQSYAGTFTFEPPAAMAEALGAPVGQLGPGAVTGQRIAVEPMGEPVGGLPEQPTEPAAPDGSPPAPEASPMAPEESPAA